MDTILIVEDEINVRENLVELLTNEGFNCIEAEDGLSGTKIIKSELPDLILCDLMMPKIDGFEFYQIVKSMTHEQFLPFIFLTARTDEESIQYAMGMGADDYITKPFKADELLERIKSRLWKKKSIEQNFDQLKMNISLYVPHELRTPLISILGYTELMLSDFDNFSDAEKKDMLGSIQHSGLRLDNRIEKFMKFSELKLATFEKKELQKDEHINPAKCNYLEKLEKSSECSHRLSDISFKFDDADLLISARDFEAMMLELLENSCKFSTITSQIEVSGVVLKDSYEITVKNEGTEIDSSVLESFYQKDKNYNQQNGNGLGLSIVKMILKKYNAHIKIFADEAINIKVSFPILIEQPNQESNVHSFSEIG